MLKFIHDFEQAALGIESTVLVCTGFIFVMVGIFVWLGGTGYRKISAAILGSIIGFAFAFTVRGQMVGWLVLSAMAGCVALLLLEGISALIIGSGSFLWNLISALFYSLSGTSLVFAGMVLLLLDKGSEPVKHITEKQSLYALVFAAMLVFGIIEQLLLCARHKDHTTNKKHATAKKENKQQRSSNWRTV